MLRKVNKMIFHYIAQQQEKVIKAASKILLEDVTEQDRIKEDMKKRDKRLREAHADYARRGIDPSRWEELDKIADEDYRRAEDDDRGSHHDASK